MTKREGNDLEPKSHYHKNCPCGHVTIFFLVKGKYTGQCRHCGDYVTNGSLPRSTQCHCDPAVGNIGFGCDPAAGSCHH